MPGYERDAGGERGGCKGGPWVCNGALPVTRNPFPAEEIGKPAVEGEGDHVQLSLGETYVKVIARGINGGLLRCSVLKGV